jgi:hypothetical protein
MQRALKRAHQRLQGRQPEWGGSEPGLWAKILYDALLTAAGAAFLGGLALIAWGVADRLEVMKVVGGAVLVVLGPALLILWERLVWEPFADKLSQLS